MTARNQTEEFVQEWRNAAYNCYSSGHKFCREVCPVMQVERNESWTPTAFHANVVAMEKGELELAEVAADYVNCTQCGACELRCPNTLFTGDFYRFRTRTVDLVKAVRALAVDAGHPPARLPALEPADRRAPPRAGARRGRQRRARRSGARRRLGGRPRHPGRRRDDPVRRLRGGVPPHVGPARGRADPAARRRRVRPDARAVVLRRPGRRDGLRRAGQALRPPQPRRLARVRRPPRDRARPARLHHVHRGLPRLLRRGVRRHRDRARGRAVRRADPRRQARRRACRSSARSPTTTRAG